MRRLAVAMAIGGVVFLALHELGRHWGATRDEVRRPMAGDDIVPHAIGQTTHAITIDAAAERVWPWLVQMGYHRAGLVHVPVGRSLPLAHRQPERCATDPRAPGPVGRRHRPGRRARYGVLSRRGPGRASRTGAALHLACSRAAPRKDDRRLDVGVRAPGGRCDDDPARPPGAGDLSAVVGPLDLRRHDRAERLHHGEEHAAWHRTPGRGTAVSR
jgi:hypothetical protein